MRKYDIPDIQITGWTGQYGLEPDFELFIKHTMKWIKEACRVLKDDGLLFINLQDTYSTVSGNLGSKHFNRPQYTKKSHATLNIKQPKTKYPDKTKLLIPQRIAIALVDSGWLLRNDIIWHKVNGLPESANDRFTRAHEYIFMFSKKEKYYFDLDSVRIKTGTEIPLEEYKKGKAWGTHKDDMTKGNRFESSVKRFTHPAGKNPRDVWSIPNQATTHNHYAAFPEKLVKRMVLCSSRPGDKILDPFCGSGTTIKVAEENNREGIGFDLGYQDIQKERLKIIQRQLM